MSSGNRSSPKRLENSQNIVPGCPERSLRGLQEEAVPSNCHWSEFHGNWWSGLACYRFPKLPTGGRLLAAVVELTRACQIQFKTRLERMGSLNEAEGICKLLERTNRLVRGCHTEWSVRHGGAHSRARGNQAGCSG